MHAPAKFPVEGKIIRFAPSREHRPASGVWRVWAEGSEIYALARNMNGFAKISVHASGQIHHRLAEKHKQEMAPLMLLPSGTWRHAFELRFLLSAGANVPPKEREPKENKAFYYIPVPAESFLCINLIIGPPRAPFDYPLPLEFGGAQPLWRIRLANGCPAVLVARMLPLDDQNRQHIKYHREELKLGATVTTTQRPRHAELHRLYWSVRAISFWLYQWEKRHFGPKRTLSKLEYH